MVINASSLLLTYTSKQQLSSIPFSRFITTTIVGLLPFQVMWVFLGTTLRSLTDVASGNVEGSTMQMVSLGLQLFAAVVVPVYVCYRSMSKKPAEEEREESVDVDQEADDGILNV